MEQFYGAIIWHHFRGPFYGACVPCLTLHYSLLLVQKLSVHNN